MGSSKASLSLLQCDIRPCLLDSTTNAAMQHFLRNGTTSSSGASLAAPECLMLQQVLKTSQPYAAMQQRCMRPVTEHLFGRTCLPECVITAVLPQTADRADARGLIRHVDFKLACFADMADKSSWPLAGLGFGTGFGLGRPLFHSCTLDLRSEP